MFLAYLAIPKLRRARQSGHRPRMQGYIQEACIAAVGRNKGPQRGLGSLFRKAEGAQHLHVCIQVVSLVNHTYSVKICVTYSLNNHTYYVKICVIYSLANHTYYVKICVISNSTILIIYVHTSHPSYYAFGSYLLCPLWPFTHIVFLGFHILALHSSSYLCLCW